MTAPSLPTYLRRPVPRKSRRFPGLEWLEDRTLLTAGLDDYPNRFVQARDLELSDEGTAALPATIESVGDVDVFAYRAPTSGGVTVQLLASRYSSLNPLVVVYNEAGQEITRNDDNGNQRDSQASFYALSGSRYYLMALASEFTRGGAGTTGGYTLTVAPYLDDCPDQRALAPSVTLARPVQGVLETPGDVDLFRFVATTTAGLSARLVTGSGSGLDGLVRVRDSAGRELAQGDGNDGLNGRATILMVAGQSYYVEVAASPFALTAGRTGAYRLLLDSFADEASNARDATAPLLGAEGRRGTIGAVHDIDVYRYVATTTSGMVVNLHDITRGAGPARVNETGFSPQVTVFDASGVVLARGSNPSQILGQAVTSVVAGQSYYIQVAASSGRIGAYNLRLDSFRDDAPDTQTGAVTLTSDIRGQVDVAGDLDQYRYTARSTGPVVFRLSPRTRGLTGELTILGAGGQVLASRKGEAGLALEVPVTLSADTTYQVRVSGDGTGAYDLQVRALVDDHANTFASATPIFTGATGTIGIEGDTDVFRFTAQATGSLRVELRAAPGSGLDTILSLFDGVGNEITSNDDAGGTLDSTVTLDVTAGQTYFARASSYGTTTGAYRLTLAPFMDDLGDRFEQAGLLALTATGGQISGVIDAPGDGDLFRIVALTTGPLVVRMDSARSGVDSIVTVLGADRSQVASDDESGGQHNARLTFDVIAGRTYYVRATSWGGTIGAYTIQVSNVTDDNTATLASAPLLGSGGSIDFGGDTDLFRWVPTTSGPVVVRQRAAGSGLDSLLAVLDATGTPLVSNDDADGSLDSMLTLAVTAGQTYFIRAGAYSSSVGSYVLSVEAVVDDAGNTSASARTVPVQGTGFASQSGRIEIGGDVDVFRYVATRTESVELRLSGTGLYPDLTLTDDLGQTYSVYWDYTGAGSADVAVFTAVAGRTYFASVTGGWSSAIGNYQLTWSPYADDVSGVRSGAPLITPTAQGLNLTGQIERRGDIDVYRIDATADASYVARLGGTGGSFLDTVLEFLGSDGAVVRSDDDSATLTSEVTIDLHAGQTYYLRVSASTWAAASLMTGQYRLRMTPTGADDFSDSGMDTATWLTPQGDGTFRQAGEIGRVGDGDLFRFVAPFTGAIIARLDATPGSQLDPILNVFESNRIAGADSYHGVTWNDNANRTRQSEVTFRVEAGQTYWLWAQGARSGSGARGTYVLSAERTNLPADDGADLAVGATTLTLDSAGLAERTGQIERSDDRDWFRFTARTSGRLQIEATSSNGLDPSVVLFSSTGERLLPSAWWWETSSSIVYEAVAGQTYFARVEAVQGITTGSYTLQVSPIRDDHADTINLATPLTLNSTGRVRVEGRIDFANDIDMFSLDVPQPGMLIVRQNAIRQLSPTGTLAGTALDSFLTIFDRNGAWVNENDDSNGTRDSEVTIQVTAAQRYYIKAGAYGSSTGRYELTAELRVDVGNTFATAQTLDVPIGGASTTSWIDLAGDRDVYRIVSPVTGSLRIRQERTSSSSLDSYVYAYDAFGTLLDEDDDSGGNTNSLITISVTAGQVYYIDARAYGSSSGEYRLSISPYGDDFGNTMETAAHLNLSNSGIRQAGSIATVGDVDLFRFIASQTGNLLVRLDLNGLYGQVRLLDSFGTQLGAGQYVYASAGSYSFLFLPVVAGQTYFLSVAADAYASTGLETGDYTLNALVVPSVSVGANGSGVVSGILTGVTDRRLYAFVPTTSGGLTVEQVAGLGSSLDSFLTVRDSTGRIVAVNNDSEGQSSSRVVVNVVAGRLYFLEAGVYAIADPSEASGAFELRLHLGDLVLGVGNSAADAATMSINSAGQGSTTGAVELPGDRQTIRIIPTQSGTETLRVTSTALDSVLYLFDANNRLLATNSGQPGQSVTFLATQGQTYYVRVGAAPTALLGRSTGPFTLTLGPDDAGSGVDQAPTIPAPPAGNTTAEQNGVFNGSDDIDTFHYVATTTGTLNLGLLSPVGLRLDATVTILDANRQVLARGGTGLNVHVVAGQSLYLELEAGDVTDAKYSVLLETTRGEIDTQNDPIELPANPVVNLPSAAPTESDSNTTRQVTELVAVDGVALAFVATLLITSDEVAASSQVTPPALLLATGLNGLGTTRSGGGDDEEFDKEPNTPAGERSWRETLDGLWEVLPAELRDLAREHVMPLLEQYEEVLVSWEGVFRQAGDLLRQAGLDRMFESFTRERRLAPGTLLIPDPADQLTPPSLEELPARFEPEHAEALDLAAAAVVFLGSLAGTCRRDEKKHRE